MKTKTKKTKINWELLAEQGYEIARCVARKAYHDEILSNGGTSSDFTGYERLWDSTPESSRVGYVAFAQFVAKALKYDCH